MLIPLAELIGIGINLKKTVNTVKDDPDNRTTKT